MKHVFPVCLPKLKIPDISSKAPDNILRPVIFWRHSWVILEEQFANTDVCFEMWLSIWNLVFNT